MAWQPYHSVWFILGFGWIALYLVRMGISPVLGLIMEEFHLSHAAAGALFSVIFYSYSAMQLPAGHLGDRFGRKKILVAGTLLWFFLSLATAAVRSFGMLVVVRFLTGIAHGIYFGNDRPTIIAHTPKEKMGKGQGISFIGLALGFFLSVFLAGLIADAFGNWRWVFVIFSLPSLLASFLIHRYIHEPDREPSGPSETAPHFRRAFTDGNLWLMYITGFVMLYGFWLVATWMPAIYREIGVTDITTGALLSGVLGLMGMAGLLVSSILTDRLALLGYGRKGFVSVCILVWALLMMATGYAVENHPSQILISILFLSSGLFVFGVWPPYYALLSELVPRGLPERLGGALGHGLDQGHHGLLFRGSLPGLGSSRIGGSPSAGDKATPNRPPGWLRAPEPAGYGRMGPQGDLQRAFPGVHTPPPAGPFSPFEMG
ncbi:MAG: MFS transporter [Deltaproteobacteria bacterium]|nr:MFS transporter [Deltaproteobacteria bacterium]